MFLWNQPLGYDFEGDLISTATWARDPHQTIRHPNEAIDHLQPERSDWISGPGCRENYLPRWQPTCDRAWDHQARDF